MAYRDDLAAAHARIEALEAEKRSAELETDGIIIIQRFQTPDGASFQMRGQAEAHIRQIAALRSGIYKCVINWSDKSINRKNPDYFATQDFYSPVFFAKIIDGLINIGRRTPDGKEWETEEYFESWAEAEKYIADVAQSYVNRIQDKIDLVLTDTASIPSSAQNGENS